MARICLFFLLCSAFTAAVVAGARQVEYRGWSLAREREHAKRREDPSAWNKELFEGDKAGMANVHIRPFTFGVFPYPKYDLIGTRSFRGAGTTRTSTPRGKRIVVGNAFFNNRSPVNEKHIGKRKDEVFFHILILTDEPVNPDGSNASGQIVSRNHPHLIGQGQLKTSVATVDYVAFLTAERSAFAIVNMRLFDLRAGRTIVIAPQKDGTLRSLQIDGPIIESAEVKDFEAKLLQRPGIVQFLDMSGNL